MWRIEEHRRIGKQLASVPLEIQKRYEKWQDVLQFLVRLDCAPFEAFAMRLCREHGAGIAPAG